MNMLLPHPSAKLEYWFFKVNCGPIALLVDWIARRQTNEQWLRVSIHSRAMREVLFDRRSAFLDGERDWLSNERTVGQLGSVAWQLEIEPGLEWIAPDIFPARLLSMTDLSLVSAPMANFTGRIDYGGRRYELHRASGMISHYWGRKLAPEWWWISANQFDRPGIALEGCALRSSLWGSFITVPLAYFYLRQPEKQKLTILPFGHARVKASVDHFEIRISRPGLDTITLTGAGRDYNDLGDGIMNTLVGDLEIWEGRQLIGRAEGTAAIERRAP